MRIFLIKNFGKIFQNFSNFFWVKETTKFVGRKHGLDGKNAKNGILNFKVSCQFKHFQKSPSVFVGNLILFTIYNFMSIWDQIIH
jgi:predicted nucleic acid-binding protein